MNIKDACSSLAGSSSSKPDSNSISRAYLHPSYKPQRLSPRTLPGRLLIVASVLSTVPSIHRCVKKMAGGIPIGTTQLSGGYLTGRALIFPLALIISLFFLWGFSYGLLDVLNKHFQTVLGITRLESTGLRVVYFGGGYLLFSPIAAETLKRRGYKFTILMGLCLYSLGAIMFWPTAHFASADNHKTAFGGFCACTLVIACGLATLETAANELCCCDRKPCVRVRAPAVLPELERRCIVHRTPHRLELLLLRGEREQPGQRSVRLPSRRVRRRRRRRSLRLR